MAVAVWAFMVAACMRIVIACPSHDRQQSYLAPLSIMSVQVIVDSRSHECPLSVCR